jgi:hypothetical protein
MNSEKNYHSGEMSNNNNNNNGKKLSPGWYVVANWMIDVSKYLMTGVLLSTVFKDIKNEATIYIISSIACFGILAFGVIVKNTEKK